MTESRDRTDTVLDELTRLRQIVDRLVIAHARDHGATERAVRHEFGLLARADEWAEGEGR